ncbi:MAG: hypothetical protein CBB97_25945 [Candidatus Endolissoclinum sp. TMED37]|nr:MAG: hypothetical protein CBB97_25945 [Candidatus Endolissoclinum sp. TMED37]|tara:strand:+ start:596 stop:1576 length:981 start_codon:yes stop_codon:yes gene_type:complete
MQSTELTKPITTESLLAEFESRFNQTLNLAKFTQEELEDTANHIRTKIHEITQNTHFGQELKDNGYQKNQMMLDIVNQEIKEREQTNEILPAVGAALGGAARMAGGALAKGMKGTAGAVGNTLKGVGGAAVSGAATGAANQMVNNLKTKLDKKMPLTPNERQTVSKLIASEGVEEQSELILAAKDMMDKVTSFLEDLASMKTEGMLELADRIRDEMGAEKSDAFLQKIQPAIEQAEATLTTTRQELDNGVRILTGEETASDPMGADDTMNMDTDLDSLDSEAGEEDDEFGASDAEAGGTEPEGRETRESKEVFEQSNRIYGKLSGK